MTERKGRPVAAILREIRDVEAYLRDAPPHSGQGLRASLDAKLDALRRELRAARSAEARDD